MKISVIGTGYVGLVSGVCFAHVGHDVTCVDLIQEKVEKINRGESPIHEDGLTPMLQANVDKNFRASTDLHDAVLNTDITLIAVGTPFGEERIDLEQIRSAANAIGKALKDKSDYHVVAVKSTVVPGTTENEVLPVLEAASTKRAGEDFGVGMNPEFLREGAAVEDFLNPDRIVVGGIDDRSRNLMADVYAPFTNADLIKTTPSTAEMIKYTANSLLATLISFSNEIGNMSAAMGIDSTEVMAGVHLDHRFAPLLKTDTKAGDRIKPGMLSYLQAGCGFGGSCFPKDVKALVAHATAHKIALPVLEGTLTVNAQQPEELVKLVTQAAPSGSKVTVLGAAFKPGTDDIRDSPTLRVIPRLIDEGYVVSLHDPIALDEARTIFGDSVSYVPELPKAIKDADAIVLITSWPEYAQLHEHVCAQKAKIVDGRRYLNAKHFEDYHGIGYPQDKDE